MRAQIIAVESFELSMRSARRALESVRMHAKIEAEIFLGVEPRDNPEKMFAERGLSTDSFLRQDYSKPLPAMACFLSHYMVWRQAAETQISTLVMEHDAHFVRRFRMSKRLERYPVVNLGRPSFGDFRTPARRGLQPLFSKRRLPGAHGYLVTPAGAELLIDRAKVVGPSPVDVFISPETVFPIGEVYPWPIHCSDDFSTIQLNKGAKNKHRFSSSYELVNLEPIDQPKGDEHWVLKSGQESEKF